MAVYVWMLYNRKPPTPPYDNNESSLAHIGGNTEEDVWEKNIEFEWKGGITKEKLQALGWKAVLVEIIFPWDKKTRKQPIRPKKEETTINYSDWKEG